MRSSGYFRGTLSKLVGLGVVWILVIGACAVFLYSKSKFKDLPELHEKTRAELADLKSNLKKLAGEAERLSYRLQVRGMEFESCQERTELIERKVARLKRDSESVLSGLYRDELDRKLKEQEAALADVRKSQATIGSMVQGLREQLVQKNKEKEGLAQRVQALEERAEKQQEEMAWFEKQRSGVAGWLTAAFGLVGNILIVATVAIIGILLACKLADRSGANPGGG